MALRPARIVLLVTGLAAAVTAGAADNGKFLLNCVACHGASLQGVEGLGVDLRTSAFVRRSSVPDLVAFLKAGRMPDAPGSVAGRPMPAFGWLPEADLQEIATYVKGRQGS